MSLLKLRPIHPGEFLREQLDELGLSARALAGRLKVPTNRITGILNESRGVTPDTALRLAKFFGAGEDGARFWLNLQQAHDLRRAELEAEDEGYLEHIEPVALGGNDRSSSSSTEFSGGRKRESGGTGSRTARSRGSRVVRQ